MQLPEYEYTRKGPISGEVMRRQLLQVPAGWMLSPAVPEGTGPASLRYFRGGFNRTDHVFTERSGAEHYLAANNWTPKGGTRAIEPTKKTREGR
jgi:hypothetical protein